MIISCRANRINKETSEKNIFGTASAWMGKISVLIKEEEDRVSNINCRR